MFDVDNSDLLATSLFFATTSHSPTWVKNQFTLNYHDGRSRISCSRVLHSQAKEIIYNVHKYFKDEKANRGFIIDPSKTVARTAKAINVSKRTMRRIYFTVDKVFAKQNIPVEPAFPSPTKDRAQTVTNFDDFDKCVLRRTVLGFYERKEILTLHKIKEELKESISFSGCIESLHKVIFQSGFQFKKVDDRKFLMERSDVVAARTQSLQEMRQLKQSSPTFVYLDETWCNQNHTVGKCWTDTSSQQATGIKPPIGKGVRLIILHAGTKDGFIKSAELVFQAKNDGVYHN